MLASLFSISIASYCSIKRFAIIIFSCNFRPFAYADCYKPALSFMLFSVADAIQDRWMAEFLEYSGR
ncbi:MAG: hypothetical protein ACJAYB_003482 [Psychromonas sp.]|jgi:hypothetical protein